MRQARWIGLGTVDPVGFHATYAGLAEAQAAGAAPIVVWGRASAHVCLGQSQGRCELDDAVEAPVVRRPLGGGAVWVDEDQLSYALVAPLEAAPRHHADWYGWALAPAIAAYASFGLEVTRCGEDLWLAGRKIAGSGAATIGRCAVVASSFLLRFPRRRFAAAIASRGEAFREALHEGLGVAMTDWASHGPPPADDALASAFTGALRATLGWDPRDSRAEPGENSAICAWREELDAPIEAGRPRVAEGIKLNAELTLVRDPLSGAPRLERTRAR